MPSAIRGEGPDRLPATERGKMRRVIFNQKGGVGKSTITVNLAALCAQEGKKTLVVDLDPQGNASQYLLGAGKQIPPWTLADFFGDTLKFSLRKRGLGDYITATPFPGLHLLPAHSEMADLAGKLEAKYKIYKLKEALDSAGDFDAVFMDTPPALSFYTLSALIAADTCLIPFDCDEFSRRAIHSLLGAVHEIREDHNPTLVVEGIIVNQYQSRANLPKKMVEDLKAEGLPVFDSFLSSSVKIRESHEKSLPLVHMDPTHKITQEFAALYKELLG